MRQIPDFKTPDHSLLALSSVSWEHTMSSHSRSKSGAPFPARFKEGVGSSSDVSLKPAFLLVAEQI